MKYFVIIFGLFSSVCAIAQDALVLNNGDIMLGEVKKLNNSVLTIETPYSDSDFTLDWLAIKKITTTTRFMIITSEGERLTGTVNSDPNSQGSLIIGLDDGTFKSMPLEEVVTMSSVKSGSWDRLSVLVDGGYSFTKANSVKQFSFRTNASYNADRYSLNGGLNTVNSSTQDSIKTRRENYNLQLKYFLYKDIFVFVASDWLASDEQDLDLRTNLILGVGTAVVRNQNMNISVALGASLNNEQFITEGTEDRSSGEGYGRLEANLFGFDDLSLFAKFEAYPSLTESERFRFNFDFNAKYDLPLDFYIGLGYQLNFDNQPQEGFETSDYVFNTSIGWEF